MVLSGVFESGVVDLGVVGLGVGLGVVTLGVVDFGLVDPGPDVVCLVGGDVVVAGPVTVGIGVVVFKP